MSAMENPQIKAVKRFENAIDTKRYESHGIIYRWVSELVLKSPRLESNTLYQGNPAYINDMVRSFPYIDEADHFFRSDFKKNSETALSQYQTNGQWTHERNTLDNLHEVINKNGRDIPSFINLAIDGFGKSGNVRGLTNLFHYAEESDMQIPAHIQIEALFWAEVCLTKKLLEQENNSELKRVVRVSDVKKIDEDQKFLEKDPVLHLFRAYRIAEMLEEISMG